LSEKANYRPRRTIMLIDDSAPCLTIDTLEKDGHYDYSVHGNWWGLLERNPSAVADILKTLWIFVEEAAWFIQNHNLQSDTFHECNERMMPASLCRFIELHGPDFERRKAWNPILQAQAPRSWPCRRPSTISPTSRRYSNPAPK
jgi:hypothetical protein